MQLADASDKASLADFSAGLSLRMRFVILLGFILAELLALSFRYDTASLSGQAGWWAFLLGQSPIVLRFGIVFVATVLMFSATSFRGLHADVQDALRLPHPTWLSFLISHLIAFSLFGLLTKLAIEGDLLASSFAGFGVLAWVVTGAGALTCWAGALLPMRLWLRLLAKFRMLILVGGIVGATSIASAWFAQEFWRPMGAWTLRCVNVLLNLVSSNTVCRPAEYVVGTESFSVGISAPCSGYEGIGLIWIFLAAYFWLFRERLQFPRALLLVPIGTVVIWVANSLRITMLILIGSWGWPEIAAGGFHSQAGWLAFTAVALGLVAVSTRSRFFVAGEFDLGQPNEFSENERSKNPAAPYLIPFLAILAATMVVGMISSQADTFYPLKVVAAWAALWHFRAAYSQLSWSWTAILMGAGVAVFWILLLPVGQTTNETSVGSDLTGKWLSLWWCIRLFGYGITIPIVEELAFRGYLTRRLINAEFQDVTIGQFTWFSWLGSSLLFGLLHGAHWLPGIVAGLVFSAILYRRGRIADAILAHMTTNCLIAAYAAWVGDWSLLS